MEQINGAETLVHTLLEGKVDVCFANPGTSEMQFVAALDKVPGMRCVLGLFEGVVTGAADGYARMADKPACTLMHLAFGLSNGYANLHNARRAQVPVVNLVGEHRQGRIDDFAGPIGLAAAEFRSACVHDRSLIITDQSVIRQVQKEGAECKAPRP